MNGKHPVTETLAAKQNLYLFSKKESVKYLLDM